MMISGIDSGVAVSPGQVTEMSVGAAALPSAATSSVHEPSSGFVQWYVMVLSAFSVASKMSPPTGFGTLSSPVTAVASST